MACVRVTLDLTKRSFQQRLFPNPNCCFRSLVRSVENYCGQKLLHPDLEARGREIFCLSFCCDWRWHDIALSSSWSLECWAITMTQSKLDKSLFKSLITKFDFVGFACFYVFIHVLPYYCMCMEARVQTFGVCSLPLSYRPGYWTQIIRLVSMQPHSQNHLAVSKSPVSMKPMFHHLSWAQSTELSAKKTVYKLSRLRICVDCLWNWLDSYLTTVLQ